MPDLTEARLALNRSERLFLALDGVAGALGQIHVLRFRQPHPEAALREAVRHLVRTFPRLRALVERRPLGPRLVVLAEGERVERLFADAFRVVPGPSDAASVEGFLNRLVNEPFDLEHALPLRARLFTEGARPVLVLSLHHVACDGRGMLLLLGALLAHLGGEAGAAQPLDSPSLLPALLPARRLGRQLVRAWRERRTAGALSLVREGGAFGPTGVRLHDVGVPLATLKEAARARGCTVSELLIAALATAFGAAAPPRAGASATVRVSLDLRPYFPAARRPGVGNYVASFLVRVTRWDDAATCLGEVRARMREVLGRFERREMTGLLLAALGSRLLGLRLLGWCVRALKRRGRLAQVTVHVSNLGDAARVDGAGRLASLAFFTPALGPYVGCVGVNGRLHLGVSYPRSEVDDAALTRALGGFDRQLAALTG